MAELSKSSENSNQNSNENITYLLDQLTSQKREIFSYIDQVLDLDQKLSSTFDKAKSEDFDNVIFLYEKSLRLTEKALNFYNIHKEKLSSNNEAVQISTKLTSIKAQALDRLNSLRSSKNTIKTNDIDMKFLNISDDILLIDDVDNDIIVIDHATPTEPKSKINNETSNQINENSQFNYTDSKKANEIFKLENCAQMFYIGTDGTVSTPSRMKNLSVYSFDQETVQSHEKQIKGFIKCGDWMYPLVPNENPGMKTNFNAYIFPNNDSQINKNLESPSAECTFIGLTFDKTALMNEQIIFFEDILKNLNSLVYQDKENGVKMPIFNQNLDSKTVVIDGSDKPKNNSIKQAWSAENIADGIMNGADYLSKGVATGTEYAAKYMGLGGEKVKTSLVPNSEPSKISPAVQKTVQGVRKGSNLTVRVSGYLVNKLGEIATATAKAAAPHIRKGTSSLLTSTGVSSNKQDASNKVDNLSKVGSSSIKGFVMVYNSLEEAAKTLGKNFTEQTVTIVDHKYGSDAAKVTEDGLHSAGNIAISASNLRGLKLKHAGKTLAKATAKETIHFKNDDKVCETELKK